MELLLPRSACVSLLMMLLSWLLLVCVMLPLPLLSSLWLLPTLRLPV